MGTNTSWFNLFLPASTDFVDPQVDIEANFESIDTLMHNQLNYNVVNYPASPVHGLGRFGDKLYNSWDDTIWAHGSTNYDAWVVENLFPTTSTSISLINGWNSVSGYDANWRPLRYRSDPESVHVALRGQIRLNSFDALTSNTSYLVTGTAAVPTPSESRYFTVSMGYGSSNACQFARIFINANGQIEVKKMGTSNSAGNVENFVSLDGIVYPL